MNVYRATSLGAVAEARVKELALLLTMSPGMFPGLCVNVTAVVTPSGSHNVEPPYMFTSTLLMSGWLSSLVRTVAALSL